MQDFENKMLTLLDLEDGVPLEKANVRQLYHAASKAAMSQAAPRWKEKKASKRACYLSAEFLLGRLIYSNLLNLGLLDRCKAFLPKSWH